MSLDPTLSSEALVAAMAVGLQELPRGTEPTSAVAAAVTSNNACIAAAATALMEMEDHPGSFEPWCRAVAQHPHGR